MLWKGKGIAGKRCVRHDLSTNLIYENKLKMLATSCNLPYLTLGSIVLCYLLDNPSFIYTIQKKFNTVDHYFITPEYDETKKVVYHLQTLSEDPQQINRSYSKYLSFPRNRRLKFSFSSEHDLKLSLLAKSCNMKKSEIAALILHYALDSSQIILFFQERYNIHRHYWIIPVEQNGEITYILAE